MESKNFPSRELECRCCGKSGVDPIALDALQALRTDIGEALNLSSAYRCEKHPDEVNKSTTGRHRQGLAFDIRVPWGRKRMRIVELAIEYGFQGFGFGDTFLHIDYRPEPLTSWGY